MLRRLILVLVFAALAYAPVASAQSKSVGITVDDLPYAQGDSHILNANDLKSAALVNQKILEGLARHHAPAIGFVNQQKSVQLGLKAASEILKQWIKGDFELGN